ncbi:MAG: hypothetical protein ACKVOU_06430 [Cytophagales bacterium]
MDSTGNIDPNRYDNFTYNGTQLATRSSRSSGYTQVQTYQYTGNNITKATYNSENFNQTTNYIYDADNNLTEKSYTYTYSTSSGLSTTNYKDTYLGYSNGRPSKRSSYSSSGSSVGTMVLQSEDIYVYDTNMNLIKKSNTQYSGGVAQAPRTYSEKTFSTTVLDPLSYFFKNSDNPTPTNRDYDKNMSITRTYYTYNACNGSSTLTTPRIGDKYTISNLKTNSSGCLISCDESSIDSNNCTDKTSTRSIILTYK